MLILKAPFKRAVIASSKTIPIKQYRNAQLSETPSSPDVPENSSIMSSDYYKRSDNSLDAFWILSRLRRGMAPRACQAYDRSMAGITSKQERFPGLIMCACFTYFTSIQRLVFSLMASNCNLARCLSTPAFALTNGAEQFNWLSVPEP